MDKFTASNGVEVWISPGLVRVEDPDGGEFRVVVNPKRGVTALREAFLAERDEELGRWRWPENPDYVVYRTGEDSAFAVDERTRESWEQDRGLVRLRAQLEGTRGGAQGALVAYFDAHPEPKPWHAAKPGEVWELTTRKVDDRWNPTAFTVQVVDGQVRFYAVEPDYSVTYLGVAAPAITAGRRIWPEVSDA